jgi:hypothetical protein
VSDLRTQLLAIREEHGRLTAKIVVDEARAPRHPLHSRFEWSDETAGEKWRLHQARELISSVQISYRSPATGEKRDVRAFHAVRNPKGGPSAYDPTEEIAEDPFQSKIMLADMRRRWEELRRKYEHMDEFLAMVRADLDSDAA